MAAIRNWTSAPVWNRRSNSSLLLRVRGRTSDFLGSLAWYGFLYTPFLRMQLRRVVSEIPSSSARRFVLPRSNPASRTNWYHLCVFRACRAGISRHAGHDFATMSVQDFTACRSRLTRVRELCRRSCNGVKPWGAKMDEGLHPSSTLDPDVYQARPFQRRRRSAVCRRQKSTPDVARRRVSRRGDRGGAPSRGCVGSCWSDRLVLQMLGAGDRGGAIGRP